MGLLDSFNNVIENPMFQLGAAIKANNTGHYGQFGPAFGAGMQQFNQQQALKQRREYQKMLQDLKLKEYQQQQERQAAERRWGKTQGFESGMPGWARQKKYEWDNAPEKKPLVDMRGANFGGQIGGKGVEEWDRGRGKLVVQGIEKMSEKASGARSLMDNLNRLENILGDNEFQTGPWENTKFTAQKYLRSVGLNPALVDNYASSEDFIAASGDLVKELLNQATGPQTDNDRAFLQTLTPGLGKDKTTNIELVAYSKSRMHLNNLFANQMQRLTQLPVNEANQKYNDYTIMHRELPASMWFNGTPVHFDDIYKEGKKKMLSDEDIINRWAGIVRGQ